MLGLAPPVKAAVQATTAPLLMPRFFLHHLTAPTMLTLHSNRGRDGEHKKGKTTVPEAISDSNTDLIAISTFVPSPSNFRVEVKLHCMSFPAQTFGL
ncbi:hypothetical protein KIN20_033928 [Parelaphostrongylus tenuis]|uniref:Uncharacterized protein n=1 Tax=Parelaphostrongylus tenuis TaxID=148309 RepID=A0AAD5R8Q4_PARTN|nr:hypothetical protein KIN20_033928 [Parelaphostrongylus tenuis]